MDTMHLSAPSIRITILLLAIILLPINPNLAEESCGVYIGNSFIIQPNGDLYLAARIEDQTRIITDSYTAAVDYVHDRVVLFSKFDDRGNTEWNIHSSDADALISGAFLAEHEIIVAGYVPENAYLFDSSGHCFSERDSNDSTAFIASFDLKGISKWFTALPSPEVEELRSINIHVAALSGNSDNEIWICGSFWYEGQEYDGVLNPQQRGVLWKCRDGGELEWHKVWNGLSSDLSVSSGGDAFVAASFGDISPAESSNESIDEKSGVMAYNSDGELIWTAWEEAPATIYSLDYNNGLLFGCGRIDPESHADIFIQQYGESGEILSRQVCNIDDALPLGDVLPLIIQIRAGAVAVCGSYVRNVSHRGGLVLGETLDWFLIRLMTNEEPRALMTRQDTRENYVMGLSLGEDNSAFVLIGELGGNTFWIEKEESVPIDTYDL
jgi:hypothetical protein